VGRLPHWEVENGWYFVTIHLAGAIPPQGRKRLHLLAEQWRKVNRYGSPQWLHLRRMIFREMELWLDEAEQLTWLQNSDVAEMVVEVIEHRHERGDWRMLSYVVMPTHLHMFFELGQAGLKATLEDFKRWTGHCGTQLLNLKDARFWQREWFDHWSRSDEGDERIATYIRHNPVKAGLVADHTEWKYGHWRTSRQ